MDTTHFTGFHPAAAGTAQSHVPARRTEAFERVDVRPATEQDQPHIAILVRSERLNPIGIDWPRFVIAVTRARLVGAVQLRQHADGSRELGSLVVRKEMRGRGIAARLIDTLLASAPARVFMITGAAFAARYEQWGFRPMAAAYAPWAVRRNYYLGSLAGVLSRLTGRRPNALAVLARNVE